MMDQDTKLLCYLDLRGWARPPQLPWSVRSVHSLPVSPASLFSLFQSGLTAFDLNGFP